MLKVQTSAPLSEPQRQELLKALSSAVAATLGKPEKYVMVAVESASLLMSGTGAPAAFVDVRSIGGLGGAVNGKLAKLVGELLEKSLGVPGDRVYLNFTDVPASDWGWNGATFG
jgi:phenylpyruvate tautomerase PptA (4-oxalocrotonate tautomerase family)